MSKGILVGLCAVGASAFSATECARLKPAADALVVKVFAELIPDPADREALASAHEALKDAVLERLMHPATKNKEADFSKDSLTFMSDSGGSSDGGGSGGGGGGRYRFVDNHDSAAGEDDTSALDTDDEGKPRTFDVDARLAKFLESSKWGHRTDNYDPKTRMATMTNANYKMMRQGYRLEHPPTHQRGFLERKHVPVSAASKEGRSSASHKLTHTASRDSQDRRKKPKKSASGVPKGGAKARSRSRSPPPRRHSAAASCGVRRLPSASGGARHGDGDDEDNDASIESDN